MTPEVEAAVKEINELFADHTVEVVPVSDGGARVIVRDIELGTQYKPSTSWIGFIIGFQYPRADVYPHYIDVTVSRRDGKPLDEGFSGPIKWQDIECIQISRRSNKLNPAIDTAATKLFKVIEWVRTQ